MKDLNLGKSRLSSSLNPDERSKLVMNMFIRVLRASLESSCSKVFVVGQDEGIKSVAEAMGADWIEAAGSNLNSDLLYAIRSIQMQGYSLICIPGDLPFVTVSDIDLVIDEVSAKETVGLVSSLSDGGTNCLAIPSDNYFQPSFGLNSFERHQAQGIKRGIETIVIDAEGMFLDVDTEVDLKECENIEPGFTDRLGASVDN